MGQYFADSDPTLDDLRKDLQVARSKEQHDRPERTHQWTTWYIQNPCRSADAKPSTTQISKPVTS
jgi:hypothetical protein